METFFTSKMGLISELANTLELVKASEDFQKMR